VIYNDSTSRLVALGDTVILRDPSQGTADLVATGRIEYSVSQRAGIVSGLCTAVDQGGQKWYVCGEESGFLTDSIGDAERRTLFTHEGVITSCDLKEPHYHFQSKDVKVIQNRLLVARPAILYIRDIPVMWLPFIFQDMRSGRRSGILSPKIGVSDIVRNSAGYRRQIEDLGYYFALNDYTDLALWLDWRSGARRDDDDAGWTRYNGMFQYNWLSRFLNGSVSGRYENWSNGQTNYMLGWRHSQEFSQRSRLNMNLNYAASTTLFQRNAFNVAQALATISSSLTYATGFGPASVNIGGSRTQYSGRDLVNQSFPSITVSTKPIAAGDWLVWTPGLTLANTETFNYEGGTGIERFRFVPRPDGTIDSIETKRDLRNTTLGFQTPLRIFGFNWQNSIQITDKERSFPEVYPKLYEDPNDTTKYSTRVFARSFSTEIDWNTSFSLPPLLQGTWNLTPSIGVVNAVSGPTAVRNVRTGDSFITQGKRLQYGVGVSPTFFGFFPGFGPFSRIRQSVQTSLSYNYAPAANVSDAYLRARNLTRQGSFIGLQQNQVSLGVRTDFEAKIRSPRDTAPGGGEKIKLLSLDMSSLSYDFERARAGGHGITNTTFNWRASSDLLPGFDLSMSYDLFEGNPLSDTSRFKPFRTDVQASLNLGRDRNPFATLTRVFGKAVPTASAGDSAESPAVQSAGLQSNLPGGAFPNQIETGRGWSANFSFSASRSRPLRGGTVIEIDPDEVCARFASDPILFNRCRLDVQSVRDTTGTSLEGGIVTRYPAQATLRGNFTFNLTRNWAVQWGTGFDFQRDEFADHVVTLQRELHDWRAIFGFTQAPNGNFAFNFYITLKAQPDIKFDYNRRTYRPTTQ
jgi:hypothetical protein